MPDRRQLAAQLVRVQAMIWSAEDPDIRGRLQRAKLQIERQLAALDAPTAPVAPMVYTPRLKPAGR